MIAVDTNVLVYVHDSREPIKQQQAIDIVDAIDVGVLLWQVACEYLAASRKLASVGYDITQAWSDLDDLRLIWDCRLPQWSVHDRARDLMNRFSLSIWDALLIAAAIDAGCDTLYSEDFDGYAVIENLNLINPFAATH